MGWRMKWVLERPAASAGQFQTCEDVNHDGQEVFCNRLAWGFLFDGERPRVQWSNRSIQRRGQAKAEILLK